MDTPVVDRVPASIKQKTVSGARTAKIVISGLMRLAARHGAVTINPVRETARIEGTLRRRPRSMTAEERQQWLAALEAREPARLRDLPDLSLMMLVTGCRIGECLAIGWDEINLDQATVDVRWRLVRRTGVGLLRPSRGRGANGSSHWRQVRDEAQMDGLANHMLRKTVASFLDDARQRLARKVSQK